MALTKPAGAWTYEDLLDLPDDGRRYEIIDGMLYEIPGATSAHAFTIVNIILLLHPLLASIGGRIVTAPLDVFFAGANPVQPDILVLLPGGRAQVVPRGIEGPPDILIEVLSPANRNHDVLTKRALYGRAGVREYWIVDPETRTVEILTLDRDALHLAHALTANDAVISPLLGPVCDSAGHLFPEIDDEPRA